MTQSSVPNPRRWFTDIVCAIAFFVLAFFLTRGAKNMLGPIAALFVLAITAGSGYAFARSAWRGIMGDRVENGKRLPKT
ncbi:MAG: hypothetical protein H7145_11260 [Akkermansiaceae bacterium]|nr:hypothetical protein [Armatimonadota bacterium]